MKIVSKSAVLVILKLYTIIIFPKNLFLSVKKIKIMNRKAILYRGEDGYIVAEVPSLPGVISQGKTREEVLRNIEEAVSLHIEVLMERNLPIPRDETEMVEIAA